MGKNGLKFNMDSVCIFRGQPFNFQTARDIVRY